MTDQPEPELQIEEIAPEDEKLIHPQVYAEQKMPIIIPIAGISVIVIVITIIAIIVSGTLQKKKGNHTNVPTPTPQNEPSNPPSPTPSSASSSPTLINLPPSSLPLILEVTSVGGGSMGEKREYTVNAQLGKNDKLYVMQRSEAEVTGAPGYVKGALDTGLRIEHEKTYLEIIPVFEGAGFPLYKKPAEHVIENEVLTDGKIFRIQFSDIESPSNSSDSAQTGYFYTTQYVENKKECSSTFEPGSGKEFPACILGGSDVILKNGSFISISCRGEVPDPKWCDSLVDEITISTE